MGWEARRGFGGGLWGSGVASRPNRCPPLLFLTTRHFFPSRKHYLSSTFSPMQCKLKSQRIKLSEDDLSEFRRLCKHLGVFARTGPNKGTVSASAFLRKIARGELIVTKRDKE